MVVESLGHAVEVSDGRKDNKDMKNLVRTSPNIKGTRGTSLGPANLFCQSELRTKSRSRHTA